MRFNIYCWRWQILFISIITFMLISSEAFACSCARTTPESARDQATVIFAGKVIAVEKVGLPHPTFTSEFPFIKFWGPYKRKNTFAVSQVWKGALQQKIDISTCDGMSCCVGEFKLGDELLVYAHGDVNNLGVGMCSRTRSLDNLADDLQILGEGTQITQTDSSLKTNKSFWAVIEGFASFFK